MDLPDFLKTNKDKEKQPEQTKTNPVGGDIYSTPKEQAQTPQNGEVQQTSTLNQKPKVQNPVAALNQETNLGLLDVIAPENIEIDFNYVKINDVYFRTLFVSGYPRFVSPGWLEPIINFDSSLDVSFYIYPVEGKSVLDDLRRKIAEMEAEISTDLERGKIVDPSTQAKLEDARSLQEQLVKGSERFFEFSFYITIPATNLEELDHLTRQIESTLGSLLMVGKQATLDMQNGFLSTAPLGVDKLSITRNMDTTSLATTFPLTSAELSSDKGILYGINSQNESFIIFDRFSLENSNMTIFATSGAGKSINYDEPVLYKNKRGSLKLEKIGKLIERTIKNGCLTKIDKEMEGVLKPNLQVLTFDRKLKTKWANVQVAARKVSPKTLHKVTTASGRQIKITGDHNLVILKKSQLKLARGKELEVGDNIPLPRKIDDYQKYHPLTINSYKILKDSRIKYLRIRNGRVGNRLFTPKTSIPDKIKIDAHFCEILGYFASEVMVK